MSALSISSASCPPALDVVLLLHCFCYIATATLQPILPTSIYVLLTAFCYVQRTTYYLLPRYLLLELINVPTVATLDEIVDGTLGVASA